MTDQADLLESLARQVSSLSARLELYERANLESMLGIGLPGRVGSIGSMPTPPPVGGGPITPAAVIPPGAVGPGVIGPGAIVDLTPFASSIRPILLVSGSLPTLPDANYPEDTFVYKTDDAPPRLYKNVADVWVAAVGPDDIQADSITAGQIAAGAISATEIAAGAITVEKLALQDEGGQTLLDAQGFGPTWQRFITNGLYNSDFQSSSASVASDINNSTNPLPYWSFVQSSGTAITARVVNDAALGSGHVVRFSVASGAAGDESYIEQIVPIRTVAIRDTATMVIASVRATSDSLVEAVMACKLLDSSFAEISGAGADSTATQTFINADSDDFHGLTSSIIIPSRDAAYLRIRIGVRRAGAANGATGQIDVCDLRVLDWARHTLLPDNTDPSSGAARFFRQDGSVWLRSGWFAPSDPTIQLDNDLGNVKFWLPADGRIEFNDEALFLAGGTTFPSSPGSDDQYYRTDLRMWFVWDGARWVSTQLFTEILRLSHNVAGDGLTATQVRAMIGGQPMLNGGTDALIVHHKATFFVNGGTALSGSHKWVGTVQRYDSANAATTWNTVNIDSGSSSTWRTIESSINGLLFNGTTRYRIATDWTKTGTPGDLTIFEEYTYRIVAT